MQVTKNTLNFLFLLLAIATTYTYAGTKIELNRGERLDIIGVLSKPGDSPAAVRDKYFSVVFPLAQKHGFKPLPSFNVKRTYAGKNPYENIAFFTWPNAQSQVNFEKEEEWEFWKSTRILGWDELAITGLNINKTETLEFYDDATYTIGFVWINKDNPKAYENYSKNAKKLYGKFGIKDIKVLRGGSYVSLKDDVIAPDYINIVEWKNSEAIQQFVSSKEFRNISGDFNAGVAKFSFHEVEVQK